MKLAGYSLKDITINCEAQSRKLVYGSLYHCISNIEEGTWRLVRSSVSSNVKDPVDIYLNTRLSK